MTDRKRQRTALFLVSLCMVLSLLLGGCQLKQEDKFTVYTEFSQLENKRIGVLTGSIQAKMVEDRFPDAKIYYYTNGVDMLNALLANKIDAYADLEEFVRYLIPDNENLMYLDEKLDDGGEAGAIFPKTQKGRVLCNEFSRFIARLKDDGTYNQIRRKWFEEEDETTSVPDLDNLTGENGTLKMAADTSTVPFFFIKDGKPVGIDVEVAVRFCKEYGYGLEIVPMDIDGILPSVATSQCDFACGGILYTEERAETVHYGELTDEGGSVIAVLSEPPEMEKRLFWTSFTDGFEKTFIREERWQLLVDGTLTTLMIAFTSIPLGSLLGYILYKMWRRGTRLGNMITEVLLWLLRGMPEVVLLMILYYVVFSKADYSGLFIAIVSFTLTFAVSMYSMIRSGVDAVDQGQVEAAYALGYSDRKTFRRYIFPQATMNFMPTFEGEVTSLIKGTSVVGYIAVQDLTKMGDIIRSRTYEAFYPLIVVTVIYIIIFWLINRLIEYAIRKMNPRNRTPEQILQGVDIHD